MMGVLATLPDELKEEIIQRSRRMLDATASIKQRLETIARFEGNWVDAKTGQPVLDSSGNPRPFIPNSLRGKCLIGISRAMNDDPDLVAVQREAIAAWEECQVQQAGFAQRIARLEISKRRELLHKECSDFVLTFALGLAIRKEVESGGPGEDARLNQSELAFKVAYDAFEDANPAIANYLSLSPQALLGALE